MVGHRRGLVTLLSTLLLLLAVGVVVDSYKVGDDVDTVLWTATETTDVNKGQTPSFGIGRTVRMPRPPHRFSLGFEEGFHGLPWMNGQTVGKLLVTFVYSKSGDGTIQSVSSKVIPPDPKTVTKEDPMQVQYIWVEEEAVDIDGGAIVMFLATLVVSVIFLLQACGLSDLNDDDDDDGEGRDNGMGTKNSYDPYNYGAGAPAWGRGSHIE